MQALQCITCLDVAPGCLACTKALDLTASQAVLGLQDIELHSIGDTGMARQACQDQSSRNVAFKKVVKQLRCFNLVERDLQRAQVCV